MTEGARTGRGVQARRASRRNRQHLRRRLAAQRAGGGPSAAPAASAATRPPGRPAPWRGLPELSRLRTRVGPRPGGEGERWTPAALRRARQRTVTALGLLGLLGVVLTATGVDMVWSSTAGSYAPAGLRPGEPGYVALVTATPTLLVASTDGDGALSGVAVVALHTADGGGSVILLPAATVAPEEAEAGSPVRSDGRGPVPTGPGGAAGSAGTAPEDEEPGSGAATLSQLYRSDGAAGLQAGVERVLMAAVTETIVIDDAGWASLVAPVSPLSFTLPDPVGARWEAGPVEVAADEVGELLRILGEGQSELNRLVRQRVFWETWVPAVAEAGEGALPGETDVGLGRFVRGLATGSLSVTVPATVAVPVEDDERGAFAVRPGAMADIVATEIPYPREPWAGSRVRVKLLNGTTDETLPLRATAPLVRARAEVAVTGNAGSFSEPLTRIRYAREDLRAEAAELRNELGVGIVERASAGELSAQAGADGRIDVTVILGADALGAIRRSETAD